MENRLQTAIFLVATFVVMTALSDVNYPACAEQKKIVDLHNNYRKEVNAKNMKRMMYNHTLAEYAAKWAVKCYFNHGELDQPTGKVGQNLYAIVNSELTVDGFMKSWGDEKYDYVYNPNGEGQCKYSMCGHYTQIIWADSYQVGCVSYKCSEFTLKNNTKVKDACFVVCDYFPGGNVEKQAPYVQGSKASQCDSDFNLTTDGLCSNEYINDAFCNCGGKGLSCCSVASSLQSGIVFIVIFVYGTVKILLNNGV